MYIADNDVYVIGSEDNGTVSVATMWKNGTVTRLNDGSTASMARAIFVK